jgi:hypothetical protein
MNISIRFEWKKTKEMSPVFLYCTHLHRPILSSRRSVNGRMVRYGCYFLIIFKVPYGENTVITRHPASQMPSQ